MKKYLSIILFIASVSLLFGQEYKIGKISKEELQEKFYPEDSTANAAYLYKNRRTYFNYQQGEGFMVITKVHERIKIYNKEGYEWASKSIRYYAPEGSQESERVSIKNAKTYNLVNGKIESDKLEKKEIFNEKSNKYWKKKKFSMPNIKEGSIVEWEYTLTSPYKSIDDVIIQYQIPVKKLLYKIETPEYYSYKVKYNGYLPLKMVNKGGKSNKITIKYTDKIINQGGIRNSYSRDLEYVINISEIEKENIPALIREPYVNNIDNYRSSIVYELASFEWPNQPIKYFSQSWSDVARTVNNRSDFGEELKSTNYLREDIIILKEKLTSDVLKIIGGLEYVKSRIKWNNYNGLYTDKGLKKAYKEGVGNISEVNLTLVAVLRELGINANPVLVSTRNNGVPLFPTISGFNYVLAIAETNEGKVLLDASEKYSLPNIIPLRAQNWKGLIIRNSNNSELVDLNLSSISKEEVNINYKIVDDGLIEGLNRTRHREYAAFNYRNTYGGLAEDEIISEIEEKNDIEILNFRISNLNDTSKPLVEMYKFENETGVEEIGNKIYLSPLLSNGIDENPFKIESRDYPIDFGVPFENQINISVQIPENYKIDSLPEDVAFAMSDNIGVFVYSIKNNGNKIEITSLIKINEGVIPSNYYLEVKDMFNKIVSKHNEKIVLTKE